MRNEFGLGLYVLDENGEPKRVRDVIEWSSWFEENWDKRSVGDTTVCNRYRVSTVFLALDHNYSDFHDSLPLLWETMIFEANTTRHERIELPRDQPWEEPLVIEERDVHESVGDMWRYTSRAGALKGHARAVAIVTRWCQEQDAAKIRTKP